MKILAITMNVGGNAPGIVFERLIKGLSEFHELDVLTADYNPSIGLKNVDRVIHYKYKTVYTRLSRKLISILSVNPFDVISAEKAIRKPLRKYDLIFSFICFNHYVPLIAGNILAKKQKIKHVVYSVDALPAPNGWLKHDSFYKGLKKFISKYLAEVDVLFSANQQMLDYQLTTFKPKKNLIKEVIYNPGFGRLKYYQACKNDKIVFLYTGGLYGPRKPNYVLGAFKKIIEQYPNSTFEFIGSKLPENCLDIFTDEDKRKIVVHPFTNDLEPYYERATALIDIDADLPNDVFLSSKISNYLTINRFIISETGENSPSRSIFKGIPSILQCGHNIQEIADAMGQTIQQREIVNFDDRAQVISLFDLNSVIKKVNLVIGI